MKRSRSIVLLALTLALPGWLRADDGYKLHSVEQTVAGGTTNVIADAVLEAVDGREYETSLAPSIDGYIFTHWSISTDQPDRFANRDFWGRALDAAVYTLYETTTNTANYLESAVDDDADGMPDGNELYWYGYLAELGPDKDSDGDGLTFALEIAEGTNPHFADVHSAFSMAMGDVITCKPNNYPWCTMRSEPEGRYVPTTRRVVRPGTILSLPTVTEAGVYLWWRYGEEWLGDAPTSAPYAFTMPDHDVELVAYAYSRETDPRLPHAVQATVAGGAVEVIADDIYDLGTVTNLWTMEAPDKSGFIFTQWAHPSTEQSAFVNRDRWGRAFDAVEYEFYMTTTNYAEYADSSLDADGDGLADGHQYYWYGTLDAQGEGDRDGDGLSFKEEVALGTNPHFADRHQNGIAMFVGATTWYNPNGYPSCTINGEFGYAKPGSKIPLPIRSDDEQLPSCWYWKENGNWVYASLDDVGDNLVYIMPNYDVVLDKAVEDGLDWDADGAAHIREADAGTSPYLNDAHSNSSLALGGTVWYNPNGYPWCTIRSEPEGVYVKSSRRIVRPGTVLELPITDGKGTNWYWKCEGEWLYGGYNVDFTAQKFTMPNEYVELVAMVDENGDVDGDGFTHREEASAGTNPILYDSHAVRGIALGLGETVEVDLQPFEQVMGAIVDDEYSELFYSPIAYNDTSRLFTGAVAPVVADLDGDGRFDFVVESETGTRWVFLNTGTEGNPQFREVKWNDSWLTALTAAKVVNIDGLLLDSPVINPVSYQLVDLGGNGIKDLLVSDADGRIWYYHAESGEDGAVRYVLQYKVWAGSGAGFASGLSIAAVDWDDDGDVDLICGTDEGRLMLLRDPHVGRPTNLKAMPGTDNVLLTWDPNRSPRTRGYNVYRAREGEDYLRIANRIPLPTYRDEPESLWDYWYRVTGLSRFYITGNSTPTFHESPPTDAIYVQFRPSVWLNDTSSFTETNVEMVVSINNSMGISADGLTMAFAYDPAVLTPVEILPTGLTEGMDFTESADNGIWTLTANGGEIKTGAGRFLRLVFYIKAVHDVTQTEVSLTAATMNALRDGHAILLELPQTGKIEIADSHPLVPAVVAVNVADGQADTCSEFALPVSVVSTERLTNFTAEVVCDNAVLDFLGWTGSIDSDNLALRFAAKDQHTVASTVVTVTNIAAVDENGFAVTADSASGTVLIHDAHPLVPAVVGLSCVDQRVDTMEEVTVPFKVTSTETLKRMTMTVTFDTSVLEWRRAANASVTANGNGTLAVAAASDFDLTFYAKDQHDSTKTEVTVTAVSALDVNDFTVAPEVPVTAHVVIHDAHPLVPAKVTMTLCDVAARTETDFEMTLAIATTEALTSLNLAIDYDTSLLTLLSGELSFADGVPPSVTYRFRAKENHTVDSTVVTITPSAGVDHNGLAAELPAEVKGTVVLADSNPWQPATVSLSLAGAAVDTLTEFTLPVTVASSERLTNLAFTVSCDSSVLEYRGANPVVLTGDVPASVNLTFYAKDQHDVTKTVVALTGASAADGHGLVANAIADASADVVIHDANPPIPAVVTVKAGNTKADTRSAVSLPVAVTTTKVLTNLSFKVSWNAAALAWKSVLGASVAESGEDWARLVCAGTVPREVVLTFATLEQHTIFSTTVTVGEGTALCTDGLTAEVTCGDGTVLLTDSNPPVAPNMAVGTWSVRTKSGETFRLPIGRTSDGEVTNVTVDIQWDAKLLSFKAAEDAEQVETLSSNAKRLTFAAAGLYGTNYVTFAAESIANIQTNSWVKTTDASGIGANGLAANVTSSFPIKSTVLIVREIGKYSPGDIDGDGKLTDADKTLLENYIKYLSITASAPQLASRYASWKLTGSALKAADVNSDGKVNATDLSLLVQWIAEWKELNP